MKILDDAKYFMEEIKNYFSCKYPHPLTKFDELAEIGLAKTIIDELQNLVDSCFSEEEVVAAFLISLARKKMGRFSKAARAIRSSYKNKDLDRSLLDLTQGVVLCGRL